MDGTKNINEEIVDFISSIDIQDHPFNEANIRDGVRKIVGDKLNELGSAELSETLAFDFEINSDQEDQSHYFGPFLTYTNDQGEIISFPDIKNITPEIINNWERRAYEAIHPILKSRYADLVWDFSKAVLNTPPSYKVARIAIDNYILIAVNDCYSTEMFLFPKLERALSLALSINDQIRINKVKEAMISYEYKVSEDEKPGLWGYAFELLILNKQIQLEDNEIDDLVSNMENRLERIANSFNIQNQFSIEKAAILLARFYRSVNKQDQVERVLTQIENTYDRMNQQAEPFQISTRLEKLSSIYSHFGLKAKADSALKKLNLQLPNPSTDLEKFSYRISFTHEEMEQYISEIIDYDFETALMNVISEFTPSLDKTKLQLEEYSKKFPLQFLFPKSIIDDRGLTIARVFSVKDDLDGNICFQISQDMHFDSVYLSRVLERFKTKFFLNEFNFTDYLYKVPIFKPNKSEIVFSGLKAYFNNDYISAISILVSQIEDAFRNLIEIAGGNILKSSRNGGFQYKILDELLREQIITNTFGTDSAFYFRIVLTDQRGWNIRNDVCHGISNINSYQSIVADRLFHILLYLSQIHFEAQN